MVCINFTVKSPNLKGDENLLWEWLGHGEGDGDEDGDVEAGVHSALSDL